MWVLRDLSNGDGADGRPYPTYVWAYRTRREAREKAQMHRRSTRFARLGPVESWSERALTRRYKSLGGISDGAYWLRRWR